jgi:hypothetical protein
VPKVVENRRILHKKSFMNPQVLLDGVRNASLQAFPGKKAIFGKDKLVDFLQFIHIFFKAL